MRPARPSWQAPDPGATLLESAAHSCSGPVAQRLVQGTHNPLVVGSNPTGPTNLINEFRARNWRRIGRHNQNTTIPFGQVGFKLCAMVGAGAGLNPMRVRSERDGDV